MNNETQNKGNNKMELKINDRIYYSGDMANSSDFGIINNCYNNKFGNFVDIKLDDGREINGLSINHFTESYSGNGSTRFVLESAYKIWREKSLREMMERINNNNIN